MKKLTIITAVAISALVLPQLVSGKPKAEKANGITNYLISEDQGKGKGGNGGEKGGNDHGQKGGNDHGQKGGNDHGQKGGNDHGQKGGDDHGQKDFHYKNHKGNDGHHGKMKVSPKGINVNIQIGPDGHKKHKGDYDYKNGHAQYRYPGDNHPGNGHGYGHHKGNKSGREFGQQRAYEARNKHKHHDYHNEREAREGIRIIIFRNTFLLTETDRKINFIRFRLNEMRLAGDITVVAMNDNLRRVELIERRRASIEVNINL